MDYLKLEQRRGGEPSFIGETRIVKGDYMCHVRWPDGTETRQPLTAIATLNDLAGHRWRFRYELRSHWRGTEVVAEVTDDFGFVLVTDTIDDTDVFSRDATAISHDATAPALMVGGSPIKEGDRVEIHHDEDLVNRRDRRIKHEHNGRVLVYVVTEVWTRRRS